MSPVFGSPSTSHFDQLVLRQIFKTLNPKCQEWISDPLVLHPKFEWNLWNNNQHEEKPVNHLLSRKDLKDFYCLESTMLDIVEPLSLEGL